MKNSEIESEIKRLLPKAEHGDIIAILDLCGIYRQAGNWEETYFWGSITEKWERGKGEPTSDIFGGPHLTTQQKAIIDKRVADWVPIPVPEEVQQEMTDMQLKAESGDAQAQFDLGILYTRGHHYLSGWGVKTDYVVAYKWLRNAALQNHTEAQFVLGEGFSKGLGVRPDYAEALKWYKLAAEQGHPAAKINIDLLNSHGYGAPLKK